MSSVKEGRHTIIYCFYVAFRHQIAAAAVVLDRDLVAKRRCKSSECWCGCSMQNINISLLIMLRRLTLHSSSELTLWKRVADALSGLAYKLQPERTLAANVAPAQDIPEKLKTHSEPSHCSSDAQ